ncbi:MAG: Fic family protein [Rhodospirillales bacterium]|nr:Fic family protein [Rhodospirillales bacterium]
MKLADKAQAIIGRTSNQLVARAASFLLLADSKASFAIEGERPGRNRIERWGKAILQAGKNPLNQTEIYRLHRMLIEDDRLTPIGYRPDGVFLGERYHDGDPMPEFIGARPDNVVTLMNGLSECNNRLRPSEVDPVLQAAALAFGFVYIHPLADGNGRLHRCLIHHVLAERKFAPKGMVFPVSSVMLDRIDDYKSVLQEHSKPLMDYIEWRPTADGNVEVLNNTQDLYRFFDCTQAAEFLYECVQRTIDHDLPHEVDYLARNDEAMRRIMNHVEMPDRLAEEFIMFTRRNGGVLPKKRRKDAFQALNDEEVRELEKIVKSVFDGFEYDA